MGPSDAISVASTATVAAVFASSATARLPPASRSAMMPDPITVAAKSIEPKPSAASARRSMSGGLGRGGVLSDFTQLRLQGRAIERVDRKTRRRSFRRAARSRLSLPSRDTTSGAGIFHGSPIWSEFFDHERRACWTKSGELRRQLDRQGCLGAIDSPISITREKSLRRRREEKHCADTLNGRVVFGMLNQGRANALRSGGLSHDQRTQQRLGAIDFNAHQSRR